MGLNLVYRKNTGQTFVNYNWTDYLQNVGYIQYYFFVSGINYCISNYKMNTTETLSGLDYVGNEPGYLQAQGKTFYIDVLKDCNLNGVFFAPFYWKFTASTPTSQTYGLKYFIKIYKYNAEKSINILIGSGNSSEVSVGGSSISYYRYDGISSTINLTHFSKGDKIKISLSINWRLISGSQIGGQAFYGIFNPYEPSGNITSIVLPFGVYI